MLGDPCQDGAEVKRWIESAELGGADEGVEGSSALAAGIGAKEQVILPSDRDRPQSPFGGAIMCALLRYIILPGANPGRLPLAPAGNTQGGSGGNEWSEAL